MKKIKIFLGILFAVVFSLPVCNAFTDMGSNHWAYETVNLMTERGILSGFTDGTFRPDDYISREQFATILSKTVEYANIELPFNKDVNFSEKLCVDIDENRWSYQFIKNVFNIIGPDYADSKTHLFYFSPEAFMNRQEVAKIMVKAKGLGEEADNVINDYKINEEQYRILERFSDKDEIDEVYKKYVAIAVENELMSGNADGTFAPKKNLTRAQIATLMSKLLDESKVYKMYKLVSDTQEGLIRTKYGYINKKGEEVIPFIYDVANDFSEGLAAVKKNGKYGYINEKGEEVIPFIYDVARSFSEGLAATFKDEGCGYIDKEGNEIIPFIYWDAYDFSEGLAIVGGSNGYGCIDKEGREIISCEYKIIGKFSEGLARAKDSNEKWGYINKKGEEIIPFIYDDASDFSDAVARVQDGNGNYIYIDKEGNIEK